MFLENHREAIAAMDFLVVPTWNFKLLYVLVGMDHARRVVHHVQVTAHPTAEWLRQQLRGAFPFEGPTYLIFDRDRTFAAVRGFIRRLGIEPKVTTYRAPWQNGICERMIGTLRRELLDHIIVWNEAHLRRLLRDYLAYYHGERTHLTLEKDVPSHRAAEKKPREPSEVMALSRCGGLHHRYTWKQAA